MTRAKIKIPSLEEIEDAIDLPHANWAHQCHSTSIAIVRSGVLGTYSRVARGSCRGVPGHHSWIVCDHDVYNQKALIIDPTLWSYDKRVSEIVWTGMSSQRPHRPHGYGSIWFWGKPEAGRGPVVDLTPTVPLSKAALHFLAMLGPLDRMGWHNLASAPMGGWPAGEIIAAMDDTPTLAALVPIDILGMVTDRNPSGLYLKEDS